MFGLNHKNTQKKEGTSISTKKVSGDLISVVLPVYNHEKYVSEAIESVLNQTYVSLELIIIDDGSKDRSLDIIHRYSEDSRVTIIEQENMGAHNAINRGLALAKGKYLAILNSDDAYEPDRFEKMIAAIEKDPELGFCCSYISVVNNKGKVLGVKEGWKNMEPWPVSHSERSLSHEGFTGNLLICNFISTTSNFFFRREVYEKHGGMRNLRFVHDWDFALRIAADTKCTIIEEPLMRYRVHDTNTISSDRKWMLYEIVWIWAVDLIRYYERKGLDVFKLAESLNLQGNDKLLWMLLIFIQKEKALGNENAEERLLDDEDLRKQFIEYITE